MNKIIDTLKWTPSEKLRKALFVKLTQDPSTEGWTADKDFASALAVAKRTSDVRLVCTTINDETKIYYLGIIGKNNGEDYMDFFSSGGGRVLWTNDTFTTGDDHSDTDI